MNADGVPREGVREVEDASVLSPSETSAVLPLSDRRWKVLPWGGSGVKDRPRLVYRHDSGLGETLSLEGGCGGDRNPTLNPNPGCPGCPSSSCASASVLVTIYSSVLFLFVRNSHKNQCRMICVVSCLYYKISLDIEYKRGAWEIQ